MIQKLEDYSVSIRLTQFNIQAQNVIGLIAGIWYQAYIISKSKLSENE